MTMHDRVRRALGLPSEVRRQGTPLLNQQCWCWGCDIRRAEGNLLLAYGFTRQRPPAGQQGSSAYSLRLVNGQALVLWGFGLFYGHPALGGLYLARSGFAPRLLDDPTPPAHAWSWEQLAAAYAPRDVQAWWRAHRLLALAADWIAGYERWVVTTYGLAYRAACVAAWRKAALPATAMADAWRDLAQRCAARAALLIANKPTDGVCAPSAGRPQPEEVYV